MNINASGGAVCTTTFATEGIHQLAAVYSGGTGFAGSTSPNVSQSVNNHTSIGGGNQFCNTGSISGTTAFSPYPSDLFVTGLTGSVSKVTLTLNNFNASFPDDLDILLLGPSSTKFVPWSHVGGGTAVSGLTITLDDGAGVLLADTTALSSGSFRPAAYNAAGVTFLSPAPARPYSIAQSSGSSTF